ncbi:c-type cytochrome [Candidatus Uabimicrobium sp. HlEnr_7]|uniref:c-type cytochrome n=1 Tax=Candidatus Uabimicrobium helgolandensis TaxID=3095367 RepID=UPI0035579545
MKYFLLLGFLLALCSCGSQNQETKKEQISGVDISYYQGQVEPKITDYPKGTPLVAEYINAQFPESTYCDEELALLFVANTNGPAMQKDGNGWISKMSLTELPKKMTPWVTGLNAPKSMCSFKSTLWVTDIDAVVAIDINSGKIINRIELDDSGLLSGIAIDSQGILYVSDTLKSRIWKIANGEAVIWDEGEHLESPNGLIIDNDKLVVAAFGYRENLEIMDVSGSLYSLELETKTKKLITTKSFGNLNGLIKYDEEHYIFSEWSLGRIYAVNRNGDSKVVAYGILGAGGIAFYPQEKWLTISRTGEDIVTILQIESLEKLDTQEKQQVKVMSIWNEGRVRSSACNACHGREGESSNKLWPNLRNQHQNYLSKAMRDFKNGDRTHPLMTPIAKKLQDDDILYLSFYYSAYQDKPSGVLSTDKKWQKGKERAQVCFTCHGRNGTSPASMWPSLIKQKQAYMVKAMKDFRDKKRDDPQMNYVLKGFNDEDIENMAYYFNDQ